MLNARIAGKNFSFLHPPPPHYLRPGMELINRYVVGCTLGEGGFGITYIGRDKNLDMRVAIKEYYPTGYVNRNSTTSYTISANAGTAEQIFEKGRDKFLNEARVLAKFASEPGIVVVRDFFEANNTAYIIMEFLDGTTLKEHLVKNGAITFNKAFELIMPVMKALELIHDQGLIHRDISPDNLMLLNKGNLKLLDFGTARDFSNMDQKSLSVMLKPGYAPMEQYSSKGEQGPWTDVYALCATIYKCITGITPEDSPNRVFDDDLKPPSSLGAAISAEQEAVLMKGMAVMQKNRIQSIRELREQLAGCSSAAGSVAAQTAAQSAAPKPVQNDPNATVMGQVPDKKPAPQAAARPVVNDPNATVMGDQLSYAKPVSLDPNATIMGQTSETEEKRVKADYKPKSKQAPSLLKNKKRMFLFAGIAAIAVTALAVFVFVLRTPNDNQFVIENNFINDYTGPSGAIIIPEFAFVNIIGKQAFANKGITRVVIPDTITAIGESSFVGNKLTSVTIPDSVRYIGQFAFADNPITSITIESDNIVIEGSAFDADFLRAYNSSGYRRKAGTYVIKEGIWSYTSSNF